VAGVNNTPGTGGGFLGKSAWREKQLQREAGNGFGGGGGRSAEAAAAVARRVLPANVRQMLAHEVRRCRLTLSNPR
jgi:hypothetical protein